MGKEAEVTSDNTLLQCPSLPASTCCNLKEPPSRENPLLCLDAYRHAASWIQLTGTELYLGVHKEKQCFILQDSPTVFAVRLYSLSSLPFLLDYLRPAANVKTEYMKLLKEEQNKRDQLKALCKTRWASSVLKTTSTAAKMTTVEKTVARIFAEAHGYFDKLVEKTSSGKPEFVMEQHSSKKYTWFRAFAKPSHVYFADAKTSSSGSILLYDVLARSFLFRDKQQNVLVRINNTSLKCFKDKTPVKVLSKKSFSTSPNVRLHEPEEELTLPQCVFKLFVQSSDCIRNENFPLILFIDCKSYCPYFSGCVPQREDNLIENGDGASEIIYLKPFKVGQSQNVEPICFDLDQ